MTVDGMDDGADVLEFTFRSKPVFLALFTLCFLTFYCVRFAVLFFFSGIAGLVVVATPVMAMFVCLGVWRMERYALALWMRLRIDSVGLTLTGVEEIHVPWSAVSAVSFKTLPRRQGGWTVFVADRAEGAEAFAPAFRAFNRQGLGPFSAKFDGSLGLVTNYLVPGPGAARLVEASRRFGPGAGSPRPRE